MLKEATLDGIAFSIISMTAEEGRVSAEAEGRSTLRSGKPHNNQYLFLFHIQHGQITRLKGYFCTKRREGAFSVKI
jgi:ketosteroid isomerase-like protein